MGKKCCIFGVDTGPQNRRERGKFCIGNNFWPQMNADERRFGENRKKTKQIIEKVETRVPRTASGYWTGSLIARPPPKSLGGVFAPRWHMSVERAHTWRRYVRPAENGNFSIKWGTRPPSPREVNSRGSSPAVGGFAPSGALSCLPRKIGWWATLTSRAKNCHCERSEAKQSHPSL